MKFPKPKRTKNRKLLNRYHDLSCIVCGWPQAEPCHIKSKGSGGPDEAWNIYPACQRHHREQHDLSWAEFLKRHKSAQDYLQSLGWELDPLWHPKLAKKRL